MFRDGDDNSKVDHLMQSAMPFTPAPTSFAPVLPPGPHPREGLRSRPEVVDGMHPMIAQAQVDAVSSQLADSEAELREYEAIREGKFPVDALR